MMKIRKSVIFAINLAVPAYRRLKQVLLSQGDVLMTWQIRRIDVVAKAARALPFHCLCKDLPCLFHPGLYFAG
jgi:hypothetical protein